jgi:branched-chain amino acid transport system permease protein
VSVETAVRPSAPQASAMARLRGARWYQRPRYQRLAAMVVLALVLTMMTGEQGTTTDLFFALREDFSSVAPLVFLAICLGVWAVREFWGERTAALSSASRGVAAVPLERVRGVWRSDRRLRALVLVGAVAAAALVPLSLEPYWHQVLVDQIAIYALLAIGLNVVIGWAGMLDLGFVAFFAIGAYSAAFWTGALPVKPPVELNNFLVIPIAVATCLLAGLILGAPTLRLRGDYLAIVTLGFHEIVYITAKNVEGFTGGARGVSGVDHFSIDLGFFHYGWGLDPLPYYWLLLGFIVLLVFLFLRLEHSRVGRAWTAVREDEVAAAASGVHTVRFKLMAFAIGASTSGIAGVAYASKVGYFNPENFPILASVLVLSYVIFGGMGSVPGVLVGTAVLVWLPEVLRDYVDARDRYMYLGALLVVMMIYRPQGVWPSRRRVREMRLAEEGVSGADGTSAPAGGVLS